MGLLIFAVVVCGVAGLIVQRNRGRARNAPLRGEIEAQVRFETDLGHLCKLGTGGFGGTRGVWINVRGPKRLTVGTDAFMISAPQALREFVFTGRESSIALTQMRFGPVGRDWIVITGQDGGRQVQLAIMPNGTVMDVWQALAATGAELALRFRSQRSFPLQGVSTSAPEDPSSSLVVPTLHSCRTFACLYIAAGHFRPW